MKRSNAIQMLRNIIAEEVAVLEFLDIDQMDKVLSRIEQEIGMIPPPRKEDMLCVTDLAGNPLGQVPEQYIWDEE